MQLLELLARQTTFTILMKLHILCIIYHTSIGLHFLCSTEENGS